MRTVAIAARSEIRAGRKLPSGHLRATPAILAGGGIVLVALAITRMTYSADPLSPVPFVLVVLTVGVILAREHSDHQLSVFSPLAIVLLAYSVMFGLVPLSDVLFHNAAVYHSVWREGAWLGWVALVLMYAGYRMAALTWGGERRPVRSEWSPMLARVIALTLLAIAAGSVLLELHSAGGVFSYFARFATRRRYIHQPVPLLIRISMATPAFLLLAGNWLRRPTIRSRAALFLVWLPIVLVASGFLGQRWRSVTVLVALLAIIHLGRRRLSWPVIAVLLASLLAAFVAVNLYRNVVGSSRQVRSIAGTDFYYNYLSGHELGQFRDFVATLEGVPGKLEFQHGRTFLSIIPGAPFPTAGYLYSSTFTPRLYAAGTSVSNTLLGELFMNFGIPGILIGMLLFGLGIGAIERWFQRNRGRTGALLVYAAVLVPLAGILRGDFTTFAGFTLLGLVPLLASLRLVDRAVSETARAEPHRESNGFRRAERPPLPVPLRQAVGQPR
jgi:oligosaccharide repeat unit polymerase